MAHKKSRINWDLLGAGTSLACAIHCAVLPLLVTSLPVFGVNLLHNDRFEYFMIFLAFAIGSTALWHGYRKHHQRRIPLGLFALGMIFLLSKEYWRGYELYLLPFAACFMIAAHFLNLHYCNTLPKERETAA